MTVIKLLVSGPWTVPGDWNNADNKVECIAGGGAGGYGYGGTSGGGGAYASSSNITLTPGASITTVVGVGGVGNTTGDGTAGTDTVFGGTVIAGSIVGAAHGHGTASGDCAGGLASASVGTVKFSGGNGSNNSGGGQCGGGGAGGPLGAGGNGGSNGGGNFNGTGGGGNGGGASALGANADGNGTAGGANQGGTGGGAGATGSSPAGAGTAGGGGGGGAISVTLAEVYGGAGGNGTDLAGGTCGSGGGGGGSGFFTDVGFVPGGAGGLYGGGGGAGSLDSTISDTVGGKGGNGAPGVIVITYTPTAAGPVSVSPGNGAVVATGAAILCGVSPAAVTPGNGAVAVAGAALVATASSGIAATIGNGAVAASGALLVVSATSPDATVSPGNGAVAVAGAPVVANVSTLVDPWTVDYSADFGPLTSASDIAVPIGDAAIAAVGGALVANLDAAISLGVSAVAVAGATLVVTAVTPDASAAPGPGAVSAFGSPVLATTSGTTNPWGPEFSADFGPRDVVSPDQAVQLGNAAVTAAGVVVDAGIGTGAITIGAGAVAVAGAALDVGTTNAILADASVVVAGALVAASAVSPGVDVSLGSAAVLFTGYAVTPVVTAPDVTVTINLGIINVFGQPVVTALPNAAVTLGAGSVRAFGNLLIPDIRGGTVVEIETDPWPAGRDIVTSPELGQRFFVVEIIVPNNGSYLAADGATSFYVSDTGYVGGGFVWPPLIVGPLAIDRAVSIDPTQSQASASWGEIKLDATDGRFNQVIGRTQKDVPYVAIRFGQKTWDTSRGIWIDPDFSTLRFMFRGVGTTWTLDETTLTIVPRDITYLLERTLQVRMYAGTGGLEGTPDLAGLPVPVTRGDKVLNVTPVLVDPVRLIYQFTNNPGSTLVVYEGGAGHFGRDGGDHPLADLYASYPPPGTYRTCNTAGCFQVAAMSAQQITADVTGNFYAAGSVHDTEHMALSIIRENCGVADAWINVPSFVASTNSGFFFGTEKADALQTIIKLLTGSGLSLLTSRDGLLTLQRLAAGVPTVTLTSAQIVSITPVKLPSNLSPTPFRWRVAYGMNNTIMTSDLNPTISATQMAFLATGNRYAQSGPSAPPTTLLKPNDFPPIDTYLIDKTVAQKTADALGTLWAGRARLYDIQVPQHIAVSTDIGSTVSIVYPIDDLAAGASAIVVGESWRSTEATATLRVFLATSASGTPLGSALDTNFLLDASPVP